MSRAAKPAPVALRSGNFELDRDVVARRVRVRADLLVRLAGERGELGLRHALVLHAELHGEAEAPAVARADRDGAGDPRLRCVLLVALADEVERAAEAGRVAGGEEVLWRRSARLARAAHLLRHREIGLYHAVARLGVAVAPAGGGRGRGKEGLDRVHWGSPGGRWSFIIWTPAARECLCAYHFGNIFDIRLKECLMKTH